MNRKYSRRSVLRGMLQGGAGSAVALGLPVLDLFLNDSGKAFADGAPLPIRFGTWFWGCGMTPGRWNPATEGKDYVLPPELSPIAGLREQISVFSGFDVRLDGKPNDPHNTGVMGTLTGTAIDKAGHVPSPTLDVLVADAIGGSTRFRSLEMSASGHVRDSYSMRSAGEVNPNEVSPLALYQRIFGPAFRDPAEKSFEPDPRVMLRQSVLSAIKEDRSRLEKQLGSHDRQRLDQYFTSVRQLEHQLDIQLSEPPALAACAKPHAPPVTPVSTDIEHVTTNNKLMAEILALALACDQTRVFNMVFSYGASKLHEAGSNTNHHQLTHEEVVDPQLGYQPQATVFVERSMAAWADFVQALAAVPEGDGTLLDNCLVMAHSETSYAKTHDVVGLPIMLAGKAAGRVRSGLHVNGKGDAVSRVGLTVQQAMGLNVESWGTRSMAVSSPIKEVIV